MAVPGTGPETSAAVWGKGTCCAQAFPASTSEATPPAPSKYRRLSATACGLMGIVIFLQLNKHGSSRTSKKISIVRNTGRCLFARHTILLVQPADAQIDFVRPTGWKECGSLDEDRFNADR